MLLISFKSFKWPSTVMISLAKRPSTSESMHAATVSEMAYLLMGLNDELPFNIPSSAERHALILAMLLACSRDRESVVEYWSTNDLMHRINMRKAHSIITEIPCTLTVYFRIVSRCSMQSFSKCHAEKKTLLFAYAHGAPSLPTSAPKGVRHKIRRDRDPDPTQVPYEQ